MMTENLLRAGLALLALSMLVVGAWAAFAPESFYDDFPGGGYRFVSSLPPYNEHLTRDYGGMNLALGVVLAIAAWTLSRWLVVAALLAVIVSGVEHFTFHASHQGLLSGGDQAANLVALATPLVAAAALLALEWRRSEPSA